MFRQTLTVKYVSNQLPAEKLLTQVGVIDMNTKGLIKPALPSV